MPVILSTGLIKSGGEATAMENTASLSSNSNAFVTSLILIRQFVDGVLGTVQSKVTIPPAGSEAPPVIVLYDPPPSVEYSSFTLAILTEFQLIVYTEPVLNDSPPFG